MLSAAVALLPDGREQAIIAPARRLALLFQLGLGACRSVAMHTACGTDKSAGEGAVRLRSAVSNQHAALHPNRRVPAHRLITLWCLRLIAVGPASLSMSARRALILAISRDKGVWSMLGPLRGKRTSHNNQIHVDDGNIPACT